MKPSIYISLPISEDAAKARERADLAKAALSKLGYLPVSPFDIYYGAAPTYADYIGYSITVLLKQDAVMFLAGWEHSPGCRIEFEAVNQYNIRADKYGHTKIKIMYDEQR